MRGEENTFFETKIANLRLHDRIEFGKQREGVGEVVLENSTKNWSVRVVGHMPDDCLGQVPSDVPGKRPGERSSEVPNDRSTLVRPGAHRALPGIAV